MARRYVEKNQMIKLSPPQLIYWWQRFLFTITRNPFRVDGYTIKYCFHCLGWGNEPRGGIRMRLLQR